MTDLSEYHWYVAIFRSIFAMLDKLVYDLVAGMFNIFNMVAGAELGTADRIQGVFSRIQLILGIIILFKLVISLFSGIVDPEGFSDNKKGFGNVIKRVVVVLVMLLLIIPLNIPSEDTVDLSKTKGNNQKTWNTRMNESGILFGTMAELQSRILNGNVVPRLILGIEDDKLVAQDNSDKGDEISLLLLRSFILINMKPGYTDQGDETHYMCYNEKKKELENIEGVSFKDADMFISLILKPNEFKEELKKYYDLGMLNVNSLTRQTMLDNINAKCDIETDFHIINDQGERYVLVYHLFLSTIAGVLFLIMILSLTIDIAVRVFKLLLLRLISPVAILSYIDPKSEKTFNNWVKAVSTTYLDLFIRLAVISFIMLFISLIPDIDFAFYSQGSAITRIFARVILLFGLLFFAKETPKFITETLGIESKGKGLFDGIAKLRAGTSVAGGIVSGTVSKFNTTKGNVGKRVIAAITGGGIGGAVNSGREFMREGSDSNSIRNANRRYVNQNYERAADESTFLGRRKASLQKSLGIKNDLQKYDDQIKYFEATNSAMQRISNAFDGNGAYKFTLDEEFKDIKDQNGNVIIGRKDANGKLRHYTLKEMKDVLNRVTASGDENLIRQVDAVMKKAQGDRLDHIRSLKRETLEKYVNDREMPYYTENDLIAYDAAKRIYDVATLYKDEAMFAPFFDKNGKMYTFDDKQKNAQGRSNLDWGATFKYAAGQAGKKAESIKNSDKYFTAKANAQRAQEQNNKK